MIQKRMPLEATKELMTLFTLAEGVEFIGLVSPGERVIIRGQKVYFRMGSLKSKISMERENGEIVSSGVLAGRGVPSQS
jgi:3-hydroxyacyl-[acyl-carrier-protein] dehydratase